VLIKTTGHEYLTAVGAFNLVHLAVEIPGELLADFAIKLITLELVMAANALGHTLRGHVDKTLYVVQNPLQFPARIEAMLEVPNNDFWLSNTP